jgi:putative peptidoglycan lipid II flippase
MKKTALLLIFITLLTKIFGFSREIVLAYYYGTSSISDAYLISLTIPGTIFAFIAIGISTGYIPIYSQLTQKSNSREAYKFTNILISVLLIFCTILVLAGNIFAVYLVKLFASGFEGETLKIAVTFTRIGLVGIYFTLLYNIFSAYLQVNNNYLIPALSGFPINIITTFSIIISFYSNIYFLAIGGLIAVASQFIFILPSVIKTGYKFRFSLAIKDENFKKIIYLSLPVILGVSVNQINILIDRTLASQIAVGGISALNYAHRLNFFVQGIFAMSIGTLIFPIISKMASENNYEGFKKNLSKSIGAINLLIIPTMIGSIIFADLIISLLFGRGAFDEQAAKMTTDALVFYSIGMVGFGLREILSRAFYSMQDTKTPMINAAIGMLLNILLNYILSPLLGIGGLALATSIAAIFTTGLLFVSLRKKIGSYGIKQILISFIKILGASLLMGMVSKSIFVYGVSILNQYVSFFIAVVMGIILYFVLVYFLKIEDADEIFAMIKKKLNKKRINK